MTGHDVLRSLARLTSELLPDFEVAWFASEDVQRPSVSVVQSAPTSSQPFSRQYAELAASFAVVASTARMSDEARGAHEAARVAEVLLTGLQRGTDAALARDDRWHPGRLPIYSYEGLGPDQAATVRAGVARVEGVAVQVTADPREARSFLVTADVRATWSMFVGRSVSRPLVGSVPIDRRTT